MDLENGITVLEGVLRALQDAQAQKIALESIQAETEKARQNRLAAEKSLKETQGRAASLASEYETKRAAAEQAHQQVMAGQAKARVAGEQDIKALQGQAATLKRETMEKLADLNTQVAEAKVTLKQTQDAAQAAQAARVAAERAVRDAQAALASGAASLKK